MTHSYHIPILLEESLSLLDIKKGGTYVDLTFGGGGHTRALLDKLEGGRVWAFDQDGEAKVEAEKITDPRFHFIQGNFRFFRQLLYAQGVEKVDGVLADLGISSHQLNHGRRGFAARLAGPLDMRMHQEGGKTAATLLAIASVEELVYCFRTYSDIQNAYKLAKAIDVVRREHPIKDTEALCSAIEGCIPPKRRYQYLAKVFQALRIAVNDEMKALEEMLVGIPQVLEVGGRAVVISYHSGEDRLVKRFFQYGNFLGQAKKDFYGHLIRPLVPLQQKVNKPKKEEIGENNRARSARLRGAEKLAL